MTVSTHSRTKAAANLSRLAETSESCFNTQPHEGGCRNYGMSFLRTLSVSTHSRTKAAAGLRFTRVSGLDVSTHSRTKAAAAGQIQEEIFDDVSTHSRTKAAANLRSVVTT